MAHGHIARLNFIPSRNKNRVIPLCELGLTL